MDKARALKGTLRYDPVLLGAVVALAAFGVVMVYSASAVFAGERLHDSLYFFKRQAAGVGGGAGSIDLRVALRRRRALHLSIGRGAGGAGRSRRIDLHLRLSRRSHRDLPRSLEGSAGQGISNRRIAPGVRRRRRLWRWIG